MKHILRTVLCALLLVCVLACAACSDSVKIARGTVSGSTYKSDFCGLTVTAPSGWVYASDEEIAQTMGVASGMLNNGDLESLLEKTGSVFDVMCVDNSTGDNFNLVIENLKKTSNSNISMEDYIEATKKNLSGSGMEFTFGAQTEVKLGENTYTRVAIGVAYSGIEMQEYMYLRKIDGYMITLTFTSVSGMSASAFEAMCN